MFIQQIPTSRFTPGRSCPGALRVVLHGFLGELEQMDAIVQRPCLPDELPQLHSSYHFSTDDCLIHQYVDVGDESWTWDPTSTTPGARNCDTINILVSYGTPRTGIDSCPPGTPYQECDYRAVAYILCQQGYNEITGNVSIHDNELPGFDLVYLQTVLSSMAPCPGVPSGSLTPFCSNLSNLPIRTPVGTPTFPFVDSSGCGRTAAPPGSGTYLKCDGNPVNPSTDRLVVCPVSSPTDCRQPPEILALTPSGYRTIQQRRQILHLPGGSYAPVDLQVLVVASGDLVLLPPVNCDYALITVKNGTQSLIRISGNLDGLVMGSVFLPGSNSFGSSLGTSVDFEWDNILSTYIIH